MVGERDSFGVEGSREMEKILKILPDRVAEKALAGAVLAAANVFKKEMKARAPMDSGRLKKVGLASKRDKTTRHSVSYLVGLTKKGFYGTWSEFGSRFQKAKPWMRPAFDSSVRPATAKMGERLGKNIDREAKKLAGQFRKSGQGVKRSRR